MNFHRLSAAALLSVALSPSLSASAQQLAFPTAEGFGRFAKGGRGGDVYIVSNLNDSGPGSLRACAEATGPRTCVFAVSGEIRTQSRIRVRSGFLTIAGQTAPGGVVLTNRGTPNVNSPLDIQADHVIVRHIRIRPGPSPTVSDNVDAILIDGEDIIVDHSSFSWGTDETFNIVGNGGSSAGGPVANSRNITIQWSMIYESLRNSTHSASNHSRSTYLGYGAQDISFHHNLIAHSQRRNPNLGTVGQLDWVNNVVYNAQQYFGELYNRHGTSNVNWVGSVAIVGPDTLKQRDRNAVNIFLNDGVATHNLYVNDNLDMNRTASSQDQRLIVDPKDWTYISASPVGTGQLSLSAAAITSPQQAYKDVLAFAGATKPARDAADNRVATEVRNCGGGIIDDPSQRGGWPTFANAAAPADADRDGMADSWETARGLSASNAADRNGDLDGDGYTNLEEYLNELAGDNAGPQTGRGAGLDPDPTCGFALGGGAKLEIKSFTATPAAVAPGGTVTLTYSAGANSCKRSWPSTLPASQTSGTEVVVISETTQFDLICTQSGQDDWIARTVFVTPTGAVPKPVVSLTSDKSSYALNEPVTLTWVVDGVRASTAGECRASGGWSGIKTVIGKETFPAKFGGDYQLLCTGPGGSGVQKVAITVSGGSPAPPPSGGPAPSAPSVSIRAAAGAVNEGNSGSTPFNFTVTRTGSATAAGSVRYAVSGSTRVFASASDFTGGAFPSGVLNFAANETSKTLTINVSGDNVDEGDEAFVVQLSLPSGLSIAAPANASAEIINDDAPPPAPTPPSTKPVAGTIKITAAAEHVRANPGGSRIGVQWKGATGSIVKGPVKQDAINWLQVNFDSGPDGWVREQAIGPAQP
ncbi:MAG TPA: hypothetical protein DEA50_06245 [Parvularcula sp.]|nr:hypothetical protein [Parvularcula sp.]